MQSSSHPPFPPAGAPTLGAAPQPQPPKRRGPSLLLLLLLFGGVAALLGSCAVLGLIGLVAFTDSTAPSGASLTPSATARSSAAGSSYEALFQGPSVFSLVASGDDLLFPETEQGLVWRVAAGQAGASVAARLPAGFRALRVWSDGQRH